MKYGIKIKTKITWLVMNIRTMVKKYTIKRPDLGTIPAFDHVGCNNDPGYYLSFIRSGKTKFLWYCGP